MQGTSKLLLLLVAACATGCATNPEPSLADHEAAVAALVAEYNARLGAATSLEDFEKFDRERSSYFNSTHGYLDRDARREAYQKVHSDMMRRDWYCRTHPDLPQRTASAICWGELHIGMTREQVRASWGPPQRINQTTTLSGVQEQWVYAITRHAYFEDGRLVSWRMPAGL